jgi:hypothetical protein
MVHAMSNDNRQEPLDPDTAYVFRKINEMGKGQFPKPHPPEKREPIIPGGPLPAPKKKALAEPIEPTPFYERPDPQILRDALPAIEHPTEEEAAVESMPPQPNPDQPSPELLELVRLYQHLPARDQHELLMIAQLKNYLNWQKDKP